MSSMSKSEGSTVSAATSRPTITRCRFPSTSPPASAPITTTSWFASHSLSTGTENSESSKSSASGTAILLMAPPSVSAGFRDLPQRLAAVLRVHRQREVTERDRADQAVVAIEHGEPADLFGLHDVDCALDVVVRETVVDVRRHDLLHATAGRIGACGRRADRDVAVGHDADQAVTVAYRQRADLDIAHPLRSRLRARLRFDRLHWVHQLRDSHGESSRDRSKQRVCRRRCDLGRGSRPSCRNSYTSGSVKPHPAHGAPDLRPGNSPYVVSGATGPRPGCYEGRGWPPRRAVSIRAL